MCREDYTDAEIRPLLLKRTQADEDFSILRK